MNEAVVASGGGTGTANNASASASAPNGGNPPAAGATNNNAGLSFNPPPSGTTAPPPQGTVNSEKPTYSKEDWRSSLPEDLSSEPAFQAISDVPTLAKSYLHAQRAIGAGKVALPTKHATDQDIQTFYDQLGRPALDKYEVAIPKDAKFIDPEWLGELKPIAHKAGVMPKQLESIMSWYEQKTTQFQEAMQTVQAQEAAEGLADLKKEWGVANDQKFAYANTFLQKHGNEDMGKWLEESGMNKNPHLIRLLSVAGEALYKEDSIVNGQPVGGMLSPSEAIRKADQIRGDITHPYHNREHLNHKAAVREVDELMQMAYPSEKVST